MDSFSVRSDLRVIEDMLTSQAAFVTNKIPRSERGIFMATMSEIITRCRCSIDVAHFRNNLAEIAKIELRPNNFLLRLIYDPLPAKRLAFEVAEGIVESVTIRFVDGGSKTFIGLLENKFDAAR